MEPKESTTGHIFRRPGGFAEFSQGVDDKEKEPAFIWPRGERRVMLSTATNSARQIPSTRMEASSERRTS
ncbi:hypothetical protein A6U87_17445 [Rhizobium sp. AC44/96]|nr:hypothetical protein A6U87_17445 [Rhizobium sp. AC44/96]